MKYRRRKTAQIFSEEISDCKVNIRQKVEEQTVCMCVFECITPSQVFCAEQTCSPFMRRHLAVRVGGQIKCSFKSGYSRF